MDALQLVMKAKIGSELKFDHGRMFKVFAQEPRIDGEYCTQANLLIRFLAEPRSQNNRMQKEIYAKCIRAWNAWRAGEEPKRLLYTGEVPKAV